MKERPRWEKDQFLAKKNPCHTVPSLRAHRAKAAKAELAELVGLPSSRSHSNSSSSGDLVPRRSNWTPLRQFRHSCKRKCLDHLGSLETYHINHIIISYPYSNKCLLEFCEPSILCRCQDGGDESPQQHLAGKPENHLGRSHLDLRENKQST